MNKKALSTGILLAVRKKIHSRKHKYFKIESCLRVVFFKVCHRAI